MPWLIRNVVSDYQLRQIKSFQDREVRVEELLDDLTPLEKIQVYFKTIEEPFTEELAELWHETME